MEKSLLQHFVGNYFPVGAFQRTFSIYWYSCCIIFGWSWSPWVAFSLNMNTLKMLHALFIRQLHDQSITESCSCSWREWLFVTIIRVQAFHIALTVLLIYPLGVNLCLTIGTPSSLSHSGTWSKCADWPWLSRRVYWWKCGSRREAGCSRDTVTRPCSKKWRPSR